MRTSQTMRLYVQAVGNGSFDAFLSDRRLCRSVTPFLTAARVLQREGADPFTILEMWHQGADAWALRSTIRTAAGLRVFEDDFHPPYFRELPPFGLDRP